MRRVNLRPPTFLKIKAMWPWIRHAAGKNLPGGLATAGRTRPKKTQRLKVEMEDIWKSKFHHPISKTGLIFVIFQMIKASNIGCQRYSIYSVHLPQS